MTQPFGPLDPLMGGAFYFISVVFMLFMFVALPVVAVLAIRFLWYRHVYVGRSAELEKLIWQLHRIASAMEAQQPHRPQSDLPLTETPGHDVSLSMFGR
jgi:hypothetical protein